MNRKIGVKFLALALILMGAGNEVFAQTRIVFRRGATAATVTGRIGAMSERRFVLGARRGQYLSATVSSTNGCIEFARGGESVGYTTRSGSNYLTLVNFCRDRSNFFRLRVSIR